MSKGNTDLISTNPNAVARSIAERPTTQCVWHEQMGDCAVMKLPGAVVQAAMSQQGSDFGRGNESLPQKLVQLVGHRDPKGGYAA